MRDRSSGVECRLISYARARSGSGAYAEGTQRGVLVLLYTEAMDGGVAFKVAKGLQEYLVGEGL